MTDLSSDAEAFLGELESELISELQAKFAGKDYRDPKVRAAIREVAARKLWDYGREFTDCIPKITLIRDDQNELQIVLNVKLR